MRETGLGNRGSEDPSNTGGESEFLDILILETSDVDAGD